MNQRLQLIIVTVLKQLKALESSAPIHEEVLLNSVGMLVTKLKPIELKNALQVAEGKGWVIGVPGKLAGFKYSLSTGGEVALAELS